MIPGLRYASGVARVMELNALLSRDAARRAGEPILAQAWDDRASALRDLGEALQGRLAEATSPPTTETKDA